MDFTAMIGSVLPAHTLRIVSLLDVLRFYAASFTTLTWNLVRLEGLFLTHNYDMANELLADTLPELKPGEGRYYVTAVSYRGENRYGRKSNGGMLTGRDPAVLPACSD